MPDIQTNAIKNLNNKLKRAPQKTQASRNYSDTEIKTKALRSNYHY